MFRSASDGAVPVSISLILEGFMTEYVYIYINVSTGRSGSLGLTGADRLDNPNCPLDPLILLIVCRNRPFSPFDNVSKSTLGPHPPPIVPTWPDIRPR